MAEWLRHGSAKPVTPVRFRSAPLHDSPSSTQASAGGEAAHASRAGVLEVARRNTSSIVGGRSSTHTRRTPVRARRASTSFAVATKASTWDVVPKRDAPYASRNTVKPVPHGSHDMARTGAAYRALSSVGVPWPRRGWPACCHRRPVDDQVLVLSQKRCHGKSDVSFAVPLPDLGGESIK